ncbi:MAG: CRTAC1 family protein [Planctomycetota bacterium]
MASKVVDEKQKCAGEFGLKQLELLKKNYSFSGHERDFVAFNLGDGSFLEVSGVSGADSVTDGRGAVYADFDNDGDLDIFLRAMHGPAHLLFRNEVGHEKKWLRIALEGRAGPRDAFGAVVRVKTSHGIQTKTKSGGSGYLSQHDPRLLFGLGDDAQAEWVEITWPGGRKQRLPGPAAGTSWRVVEGEQPVAVPERRFRLGGPG